MLKFFKDQYKVTDAVFVLIIVFISLSSFFHVMKYWELTNKAPFQIITAISTELIIIGSMMMMRFTSAGWWTFIIGIVVQSIGNVYYSFLNINSSSAEFIAFTELFDPLFILLLGEDLEVVHYKRALSVFNGVFYISPIAFLYARQKLAAFVENKKKELALEEQNKIKTNVIETPNVIQTNEIIEDTTVKNVEEVNSTVKTISLIKTQDSPVVEPESVVEPTIVVEEAPVVEPTIVVEEAPVVEPTIVFEEAPVVSEENILADSVDRWLSKYSTENSSEEINENETEKKK
jgi:hypothetical protein